MKPKKTEKLLFLIFTVIGILVIIVGVFYNKSFMEFKKTAVETEATITEIYYYSDSDGETHGIVYVAFEVDGKMYQGELGYYSSGMYEGDVVEVLYNPQNPNDFKSSSNFLGIFFIIIGLVFLVVGVIPMVIRVKKKNNNKKLLEIGEKIYADFVEVRRNYSYSVNNRNPYLIICEKDGVEYKSGNLWKNPESLIEERNIKSFPVYIDPQKPKKYYLSLEEIDEWLDEK